MLNRCFTIATTSQSKLGVCAIQPLSICVYLFCILLSLSQVGCLSIQDRLIRATSFASPGIVQVKSVPHRNKHSLYQRFTQSAPRPSARTELLLRKYDLEKRYDADPDAVIEWFQQLAENRPTMDEIHGLAEIAEIQADWSEARGDSERSTRMYATAVIQAYQFLFDSQHDVSRNAYDPQFRNMCDIYNRSLEGLLRKVISHDKLLADYTVTVGNPKQGIEFQVQVDGRWDDQVFERFELVSNFQAAGIENQFHTYGLGVPLIAVRKQQELQSEFEKFYPAEITIPMTAFMHLLPAESNGPAVMTSDESAKSRSPKIRRAVLKLYDPLEQTLVKTDSHTIPLESDITTPLAYGLRDPLINKGALATAILLDAEFAPETYGMFMLEPYDPDKIPVVMVHGFWSGPQTWVHMFNDLRANRDIHENCQFWFYSYPTGQPFWVSAQQMRADLAEIQRELDPRGDSQSLDQMVLVGHSMGGLIAKMQVIESEDRFWDLISDHPIESLKGDRKTIAHLRDTFYFQPNPSIERVITLATPFQGTQFANQATQWVSQKLFTLPPIITRDFQKLAQQNKGQLKSSEFLTTTTSIDSLTPKSPAFAVLNNAPIAPSVKFHNIIGRQPRKSIFKSSDADRKFIGDGVVSVESATLDEAESQAYVSAEHSELHQDPGSIFEVKRVLMQHLSEHGRIRLREIPQLPVARDANLLIPTVSDTSEFLRR
ncbi:MAG: hypothetical protein ACI87E_000310 [Mariniblastus sp.]|jgi:hypothetical protein